jgi:hypothetical protein
MIAHVAFWEETVVEEVRLWQRTGRRLVWWGPRPDDPCTADVHNAREASWARSRSASEVLGRWDRAHDRIAALVASFSDAEAEDERYQKKIRAETYGHYPEHLAEIQDHGLVVD